MLKAISLFTGAGGLDLGFEAAGFATVASVECDVDARRTIQRNRPQWGLLGTGDIHEIEPREILKVARVRSKEIDVVIAGPPCQPFSKSAYWSKGSTARMEDPRAATLKALLRAVDAILPKAVVIENVRGIAFDGMDDALSTLRKEFRKINLQRKTKYTLGVSILNAVDYGVPQNRERVFLVAFRNGATFDKPTPTHLSQQVVDSRLEPVNVHRTAWDAIGDLCANRIDDDLCIKGKWGELLKSIPEGANYLFHTNRGGGLPLFGWRTRYWSFLLKLAKCKPSWTLQANPGPAAGPFHWDNRLLSVREMCRLQSFPDDFTIIGNYRAARRQLGNAVPPALAEAVARSVRTSLGIPAISGPPRLATQRANSVCPGPAKVWAAPREFEQLVGRYKAHPGPGKGPRAQALAKGELQQTETG